MRGGTSPEGLPIGVQLVAPPWREDVALAGARVVEAASGRLAAPADLIRIRAAAMARGHGLRGHVPLGRNCPDGTRCPLSPPV